MPRLIVCVVLLALTACATSTQPTAAPTPSPTQAPTANPRIRQLIPPRLSWQSKEGGVA
jgi:hypothetical protein